MAHGAVQAGAFPVLCTIGDSTFSHSGLSSLLGAIKSDANMTVIILDNSTTAMTGAQDSYAHGEPLLDILKGVGVKDLHSFEPLKRNHEESVKLLRQAIDHKGLSVVVARRACIQLKSNRPVTSEKPVCEQGKGKE
jgi:indolepyruvate ferredoxin oxidoreductase alpha subunit